MAQKIANRAKETSTTTGTGTISLLGAVASFQTLVNGAGNGNTVPYLIDNGAGEWELTWGTLTSGSPDTITRGTFIKSSTGSRVSFSAGTKTVAIVSAVELILWVGQSDGLIETSIASATTTDLGTVPTFRALITGTTTITGFGSQPNTLRYVRFSGALTLTHNATSLILLGGASRTTVANAVGIYVSDGSGNWRELHYQDQDISSKGSPTFSAVNATGTGFIAGPTIFAKGESVAGGTTNTQLQAASAYQKTLVLITWDSGSGYALVMVSSAGAITIIASSNAAGGNDCFDTTNGAGSNGGNGIAFFISAGNAFIQKKTNYSAGTITVHRFGG